ncbi:MAG: alpha amylase family protein [Muribaculaceae bacterium]|nr:alpha amylase family protein [Muribaculaceae bacterium]
MFKKIFKRSICFFAVLSLLLVSCGSEKKNYWPDPEPEPEPTPTKAKPSFIWIDLAANFPDFANDKEKIARDLKLAKDAGFTDIVVDVRPTTGDVMYKTSHVDQVKSLYAWVNGVYTRIDRTATWDYLQAFIDEARKQDLKIHAAFNTFVGGNQIDGGSGILFRDSSKASWATYMNTGSGIKSIMDGGEFTKFLNPANPEVVTFLCNLLKDLAKYDLDGIFLDRGRFLNLQADFSNISRSQFEAFIGTRVQNFPADILSPGTTALPSTYPKYLKQWLEFRAKTIYDFMDKAQKAVKSVNSKMKFGVYVGGWYSSYYDVGVNWAGSSYDPSRTYKWATEGYKNYGYAKIMDQMLIGAYASPFKVYGTTEWTMQGFCQLAKEKVRGECPMVAGGPDVGNWDYNNKATQEEENQAIVNSVKACMDACDGYFLFDMIHLKISNQWKYAKEGIEKATK